MKRLINKILFGLTLTGGSLGLHSCGDWLDINSNELAATKTEAGYLFNYAAINYSSKRVGGDQWLPIIYAAQVASDADNWFVGDDMYNISTYATGNGWVTSYSSCGYNLLKAIEFATGENDSNSVAQCKILLANTANGATSSGFEESDMLYLEDVVRYATVIVSTVPILCVYPFCQKYFMKGVMMGSVKE